MGRSVTCTFSVHTQVGGREYITGAMSLKQAFGNLKSEAAYEAEKGGIAVTTAFVWPQTAAGRKVIPTDYMEINIDGSKKLKTV